jgi:FtsP/CotA-like multicopper oxidase with cupredoxin domain
MLGRRGNVLLMNGQPRPKITIPSGSRERWRFVNSANGRYFNLRLAGHSFTVIAWDGGLLPQPYSTETLLITPGERYEVLVTLMGASGSLLELETIHYDRGHEIPDPGPKPLLQIALGPEAPSRRPQTRWSDASC